jgi:GTPase involved in cell partitioning and DNA repair
VKTQKNTVNLTDLTYLTHVQVSYTRRLCITIDLAQFLSTNKTPEEQIARLHRELAHVHEQLQIEHALVRTFKARAEAAEDACRKLERRLQRRQAKMPATNKLTDKNSPRFDIDGTSGHCQN